MQFELTQEILDQIIFAMEDQTEASVVDTTSGEVVALRAEPAGHDAERYAPIPEWKPVNGYQLMERFVAALRNPLLREQLREALAAGRGVFRGFKDSLRKYPEIEKRWYAFKEREMRRVVHDWYNQLRELQGLERLDFEPAAALEEAEELIEADFVFALGVGRRERELVEADRAGFLSMCGELGAGEAAAAFERRAARYPTMGSPESVVVVAEDLGEQLGGVAWAVSGPAGAGRGTGWRILQLYVSPSFRGIGLGGALLRRLLAAVAARGAASVLVDLGGTAMAARGLFAREGFATVAELLRLDVRAWELRDGLPPG
jgi:ribosomal protein S18 acetylase RimI-like enzyme